MKDVPLYNCERGEWKYNHYILFEQNTTTIPVLLGAESVVFQVAIQKLKDQDI